MRLSFSRLTMSALLAAGIACGSGGVVGGECREGLTACGSHCVDLNTDPANCGACGATCPAGVSCGAGVCDGAGGAGGAGGEAGAAGEGGAGGAPMCLPPFNTADACGSCDARCSDPTPFCSLWNDEFICVGSCPKPYQVCGTSCVDTSGDPEHCGRCDNPCDEICQNGVCVQRCSEPFVECNGMCVDVSSNPGHCGGCFGRCEGDYDCVGGRCLPPCGEGLTRCGEPCVDLLTDAQHCGSCHRQCPTGICQAGNCVGAVPGHVVLACTNYARSAQSSPQAVLLGNAVFLPQRNPIRILAYDEFADAATASRVDQTIGWEASARNRTWELRRISAAGELPTVLDLSEHDVVLIYDQSNAEPGRLSAIGADWAATLDSFVRGGGTVIALTSGTGPATDEMADLITASGIADVTTVSPVTDGTLFYNHAPGDAVGLGVLSPFAARSRSCVFTTSVAPSTDTTFVVTDDAELGAGAPSVIHIIR